VHTLVVPTSIAEINFFIMVLASFGFVRVCFTSR